MCLIGFGDVGVFPTHIVSVGMRQTRDPIEHVKLLLIDHGFSDATEIKRHEKSVRLQPRPLALALTCVSGLRASDAKRGPIGSQIRKEVSDQIEEAKEDKQPPVEFLWKNT